MILVSSCLAGIKVRYDGGDCLNDRIKKLLEENKAISICPEVLGGLPIPRIPAEIVGGDGEDVLENKALVMDQTGKDVTDSFLQGAYAVLKKAQEVGATCVILKENSPSCGSSFIYNGHFNGEKKPGMGVTTALLKRNGIEVISEKDF
ncbi:DUF523 domain-containing protein [Cytobacillus sp. Hz8]|uniref:DUF523 domain-containing protein n=1 Tax=Cytobacillus sp. Hz8 TaxID=3347168 RepID=UPI0035D911D5